MDNKTHSLVFKGQRTREIAKICDNDLDGNPKTDQDIMQEAMLHIRAFCAQRNFKIYYTRIWTDDGVTIFDVGSHTEFFCLISEINLSEEQED